MKGEGEPSKAEAPLAPRANSEWSCWHQKPTQSAKPVFHASPPTHSSCPSATSPAQPPSHAGTFSFAWQRDCSQRSVAARDYCLRGLVTSPLFHPWPPSRHLSFSHSLVCLLPTLGLGLIPEAEDILLVFQLGDGFHQRLYGG